MEDFIRNRLKHIYDWPEVQSPDSTTGLDDSPTFNATDGGQVIMVLKHMFSIRVFWNNEKALAKMEAYLSKIPANKFTRNEVIEKLTNMMDSL
ncbi:MAG TPA: hypothetical protein VKB19_19020 [Pedobacter sp.]|nr:hypothetical protein [Pedobacter sp.]